MQKQKKQKRNTKVLPIETSETQKFVAKHCNTVTSIKVIAWYILPIIYVFFALLYFALRDFTKFYVFIRTSVTGVSSQCIMDLL